MHFQIGILSTGSCVFQFQLSKVSLTCAFAGKSLNCPRNGYGIRQHSAGTCTSVMYRIESVSIYQPVVERVLMPASDAPSLLAFIG